MDVSLLKGYMSIVEEVTVYRNLHGRSEAETCKLDNGRGEAEFIIVGIRSLDTSETWNPIIPRKKRT